MTILNRHEKSYCKRNFIKIYQLGSNILFLWKRSSTGIFRYYSSAYTLPKKSSRRLVTFNWTNSIRIFAPFTRHATNSLPLCARMRVACACAWRAQFTSKSQSRQGPSMSVAWAILMAGKGRRYTKVFVALLHLSPPRAKGYRKNAA